MPLMVRVHQGHSSGDTVSWKAHQVITFANQPKACVHGTEYKLLTYIIGDGSSARAD